MNNAGAKGDLVPFFYTAVTELTTFFHYFVTIYTSQDFFLSLGKLQRMVTERLTAGTQ